MDLLVDNREVIRNDVSTSLGHICIAGLAGNASRLKIFWARRIWKRVANCLPVFMPLHTTIIGY